VKHPVVGNVSGGSNANQKTDAGRKVVYWQCPYHVANSRQKRTKPLLFIYGEYGQKPR